MPLIFPIHIKEAYASHPLMLKNLAYSIDLDFRRGKYLFPNLSAGLVVTCRDQHPMPDLDSLGLQLKMCSYGPGRNSIELPVPATRHYLNSALKPISRDSAVLRA